MSDLQAKLTERDRELEIYMRFLALIDQKSAALRVPYGEVWRTRRVDERIVKILKANFFLLLYNLVEASVRDGFRNLYSAMRADGSTVRAIKEELRLLWIDAAVDKLTPQTANQDSYREVTRRLVKGAVDDVAASLRIEDLRFGGNLDAASIRRTCQEHGVSFKTHPRARGGEKLRLVRDRRNDLAHGSLSFAECGRDYTLPQLVEIRRETLVFVRGILRNVERYAAKKTFRSA
ncbi:MAG TPA: MAE_28990/MAE_18760 family HEPN-like nuclease [Vicinamibacterales bacterium]|nr:MAE_28990/MAE_18760 family HEPN-like nuclease [Vicinamibacterales bacterium]